MKGRQSEFHCLKNNPTIAAAVTHVQHFAHFHSTWISRVNEKNSGAKGTNAAKWNLEIKTQPSLAETKCIDVWYNPLSRDTPKSKWNLISGYLFETASSDSSCMLLPQSTQMTAIVAEPRLHGRRSIRYKSNVYQRSTFFVFEFLSFDFEKYFDSFWIKFNVLNAPRLATVFL